MPPNLPLTDRAALEDYSRAFADALFAEHPEWLPLARLNPEDASLFLEVPSPNDPGLVLSVYTDDREVAVAFGDWHTHFGGYGEDEGAAHRAALRLLRDIITERVAVQVWMEGDTWVGAGLVTGDEGRSPVPSMVAAGASTRSATHTHRRSWLGTRNSEDTTS